MLHLSTWNRAFLHRRRRSGRRWCDRFFDNGRARIQKHGHGENRHENDQFFHSLKLFPSLTVRRRCLNQTYFGCRFSKINLGLIVDLRSQFLRPRPQPLRFEDALFQSARPGSSLTALLFPARDFSGPRRMPTLLQRCGEAFAGELAIECLRARVLDCHRYARGHMAKRDRSRNFVDVLSARTAGTSERLLQIGLAQHGKSERRNVLATVPENARHPD